jgi:hypothetical protein
LQWAIFPLPQFVHNDHFGFGVEIPCPKGKRSGQIPFVGYLVDHNYPSPAFSASVHSKGVTEPISISVHCKELVEEYLVSVLSMELTGIKLEGRRVDVHREAGGKRRTKHSTRYHK